MPNAAALAVYQALSQAGAAYDMVDYGSFAMNVMRMEKGYPGAGELNNEVTLPEAAVMRFVKLDKGEFLGRDATVESASASSLPWVCAYLR